MGTIASITMAVGVSFGEWFDVGFLWMMPCSLAAGVIVGTTASWIDSRFRSMNNSI